MTSPALEKELNSFKNWLLGEEFPKLRALTLSYFRPEGLTFERKKDLSPVTIADRTAEEKFREDLRKQFPHMGCIGEEHGVDRADADLVVTIDPIDGTRAFSRGLPFWGTQIALLEKKQPLLGAVDYPKLDTTVWAIKNQGCWEKGQPRPMKLRETLDFNGAVLSLGAFPDLNTGDAFKKFSSVAKQFYLVRAYGDCVAYLYLIRGQVDLVYDVDLQLWDSAPLLPLVQEAGGVFISADGVAQLERVIPYFSGTSHLVHAFLKATDLKNTLNS